MSRTTNTVNAFATLMNTAHTALHTEGATSERVAKAVRVARKALPATDNSPEALVARILQAQDGINAAKAVMSEDATELGAHLRRAKVDMTDSKAVKAAILPIVYKNEGVVYTPGDKEGQDLQVYNRLSQNAGRVRDKVMGIVRAKTQQHKPAPRVAREAQAAIDKLLEQYDVAMLKEAIKRATAKQ